MSGSAHIQRLLLAASVPEAEKINVVHIVLHCVARSWFDVEFVAREGVIIWDTFQRIFYKKFFPADARFQMIERFFGLQQGIRTVDDYAYEFDQLSKYATAMLPMEHDKVMRFIQGLRPDLRRFIVTRPPERFILLLIDRSRRQTQSAASREIMGSDLRLYGDRNQENKPQQPLKPQQVM